MSDVLTALLGRAAGVLVSAFARLLGIPGDVSRHDAAIDSRSVSLVTWVTDRNYALRLECDDLRDSIIPTDELPIPPDTPVTGFRVTVQTEDAWKGQAAKVDKDVAFQRSMALWAYRDELARAEE